MTKKAKKTAKKGASAPRKTAASGWSELDPFREWDAPPSVRPFRGEWNPPDDKLPPRLRGRWMVMARGWCGYVVDAGAVYYDGGPEGGKRRLGFQYAKLGCAASFRPTTFSTEKRAGKMCAACARWTNSDRLVYMGGESRADGWMFNKDAPELSTVEVPGQGRERAFYPVRMEDYAEELGTFVRKAREAAAAKGEAAAARRPGARRTYKMANNYLVCAKVFDPDSLEKADQPKGWYGVRDRATGKWVRFGRSVADFALTGDPTLCTGFPDRDRAFAVVGAMESNTAFHSLASVRPSAELLPPGAQAAMAALKERGRSPDVAAACALATTAASRPRRRASQPKRRIPSLRVRTIRP